VLPPAAIDALGRVIQRAADVATGETENRMWSGLTDDVTRLYLAAEAVAPAPDDRDMPEEVSFGDVTAREVRRARDDSGWTQEQLGGAMRDAGHPWQRVTVAEVEGGGRRVSLEELLALAIVFGVPMVRFLLPGYNDYMRLPEGTRCYRTIDDDAVADLMLGPDSQLGPVDRTWERPTHVAKASQGRPEWRPAPAMWDKRHRMRPVHTDPAVDASSPAQGAAPEDERATR
jgi:transcriptional regulator with XRE-family HTH domain